nr:PREDICTED: E3 ubiquitin-protein ligase RNF14-like [Linepithema humile]XP_012224247.1 PREDICTED: E3 ubiquitin-protein ligase RNF14-like [Linepithema humile]XP_012224248.1 PREDICTED: E3 ubiquitin-protein ligase RNF14-like [Linepithema humile]
MSHTIISNRERQEDEVTALSNVYDENEFFSTKGEQIKCTISVFPYFSKKLEVNFADYTSFNTTSDINDKIFVEYLPPIKLYISLPDLYPSQKAPNFFLSITWLPLWKISFICQKLDEIWEENKNNEILFHWIEFLKHGVFDLLDIRTILDVSFMNTIYTKLDNLSTFHSLSDLRAINGALSLNIKKLLMNYDREQHLTQFNKKDFTCDICFEKYKGLKCIELKNCGHVYCKSCMQEYVRTKLGEYVKIISCPTLDCKCKVHANDIKILCPSIFPRYEELMVRVALDTMNDVIYCPKISCQYPVIRDLSDTAPICPNCNNCFCIYCRKVYHGTAPCEMTSDHIKELVKEYKNSDDKKKKLLEKKYGRRQMQLVEKRLTTDYLKDNAKSCPKCRSFISKTDGCNKMTCQHCQCCFCWLCGEWITSMNAYEHFTNVNNLCFGRLFENMENDDNDDIIQNIIWLEYALDLN